MSSGRSSNPWSCFGVLPSAKRAPNAPWRSGVQGSLRADAALSPTQTSTMSARVFPTGAFQCNRWAVGCPCMFDALRLCAGHRTSLYAGVWAQSHMAISPRPS
eukprot:6368182-Lingulodinium_polyedra.AAC.1